MREVGQYSVEQFLGTTKIFNCSFSPDEKQILFTSDKTGIYNAYAVPICGGVPQQLTRSIKENTFALSYFPNDFRILFSRDCGGNENYHLYVLDPDGNEKDITPGEHVRAVFQGWSHDGKSLYCSINERDPRFSDIYKFDITSFKRSMLYRDTEGYQFRCVSNDEKYVAFTKPHIRADSDVYLYDLAQGEMRCLTPHAGNIIFSAACFDVSSRYLYYLTDQNSEFLYVCRYDIATGKSECIEKRSWDVCNISFSHGGRFSVTLINENACIKVKIYDHRATRPFNLPKFPEGDVTRVKISDSERLMAFYINGDRAPNDLYVCDLDTKKVCKLTASLNPEIDRKDLVESEVISYESFDRLRIHALLWKPHQAAASNKVPALVWVHGGPGGQTRKGYNGKIQYLVNHGYAVLGVDNRGSVGYGKSFLAADDHKHGREPLWDCVEAKNYLATLDYVDPSRIGIIGASYGGYMVLAALAFRPEEFVVGVDLFGVSNWIRTIESFPPYWLPQRQRYHNKIGDPKADREMLREISPLFHADKIARPLLVLQGANDPRVLKAESDEIVEAIRKRDGVVEYLVFSDEGHGFTRKGNKFRAYKTILDFLDRYLKLENQPVGVSPR